MSGPSSSSTAICAVIAVLPAVAMTQEREQNLPQEVQADATQHLPSETHSVESSEELDEVFVSARQRLGSREDIVLWLRRLAGRFRNEGTLDRSGWKVPVHGVTDCIGIGSGPGMNCVITLEAPGTLTNLTPGSFLLGVDLESVALRYMSVDSTGAAVGATGELRGDTARFQTPCEASFARKCHSVTRITAERRSENLRLSVDIVMDGRVTARYDVTQVRVKEKD